MRSNFSQAERILSFPAAMMTPENVTTLVTECGADLPATPLDPASETHRVIMGGLDRADSDDLRALLLGITCQPTPLTDGRLAVKGYWSIVFEAAMATHPLLADADWITDQQLAELRYQPSGDAL